MLKKNRSFLVSLFGIENKFLPYFSFLFGISLVLSISHHWINFWGSDWQTQLLGLLISFPVTVLIFLFLSSKWRDIKAISRNRWLAFIPLVFSIALVGTLYFFAAPISWHLLEIVTSDNTKPAEISIIQLKTPQGVVRFSEISKMKGWSLLNGIFSNTTDLSASFKYSFSAKIDKPVTLVFLKSNLAGNVRISLDGKITPLNLFSEQTGKREISINTQYKFGIPSFVVFILIFIFDMIAFASPFTLLWVFQEISQNNKGEIQDNQFKKFFPHHQGLIFLLVVSIIVNIISIFSTRLFFGEDSTSYIQGILYWLQHYSLAGVSQIRGPGTTFLFLPIFLVFGKNPWGIKIFLHVLAIASVLLSYRIGWQLSKRRWFAFLSGLIVIITPEIVIYSNYLMSDLPNAFLGLLFCTLLLSALQTYSWKYLLSTMLVGSFAALTRSENSILLIIGFIVLFLKVFFIENGNTSVIKLSLLIDHERRVKLIRLTLITMLALVPIFSWSLFNYFQNGFFGLSNYAGEILYDGWVYFGEASHIPITAENSPAVQVIKKVYLPTADNLTKVPTGWDIYPYLLSNGYDGNAAFKLMGTAAMDSIQHNPEISLKLLGMKLINGFTPEAWIFPTMSNNEAGKPFSINGEIIFSPENYFYPPFVAIQNQINSGIKFWYQHGYQYWVWLSLIFLPISFYRKPFFMWFPIILITILKIIIPTVLGMSLWRYVISGIIPLQIISLSGLQVVFEEINNWLKLNRTP